jgi:hypothetical protein
MKQRIKTLCASGVLALALFGVAAAGPLDEAKAAAERGDYATKMRLIRPLAEQGDAHAQGALSSMYLYGQERAAALRAGSRVVRSASLKPAALRVGRLLTMNFCASADFSCLTPVVPASVMLVTFSRI